MAKFYNLAMLNPREFYVELQVHFILYMYL